METREGCMVRTAASMRALQHPPPEPSVQATVHALMGGPEQPVAPIDVDAFTFGSEPPLVVRTQRAPLPAELQKACDLHTKLRGPFALCTKQAATPARGARRSSGASLRRRRRFRVASGRGCCAQLAIAPRSAFSRHMRARMPSVLSCRSRHSRRHRPTNPSSWPDDLRRYRAGPQRQEGRSPARQSGGDAASCRDLLAHARAQARPHTTFALAFFSHAHFGCSSRRSCPHSATNRTVPSTCVRLRRRFSLSLGSASSMR